jgi:AcrR family transcriptional regulator
LVMLFLGSADARGGGTNVANSTGSRATASRRSPKAAKEAAVKAPQAASPTVSKARSSSAALPGQRKRTKGERTRARIMHAARRVFEERGYLDTRVNDIAEEAGIAIGSFYTYFDSRESLFLTLVQDFYMDLNPVSLDGDSDEDSIENIDRTNRAYFDFYRRNAGMLTLIESTATYLPQVNEIRLSKRRQNVAQNVKAIVRMQEKGLIPGYLDPFVTASALLAMIANFTYSWMVLGEDFEPEIAARHMTTLWAQALGIDHTVPDHTHRLLGSTAVPSTDKAARQSR